MPAAASIWVGERVSGWVGIANIIRGIRASKRLVMFSAGVIGPPLKYDARGVNAECVSAEHFMTRGRMSAVFNSEQAAARQEIIH
jgi:hypothetical protein